MIGMDVFIIYILSKLWLGLLQLVFRNSFTFLNYIRIT